MLETWRYKRERRKRLVSLKKKLKNLIVDFLNQNPTLSNKLELFTATDNTDLRSIAWEVIYKDGATDPNDLIAFLDKVPKDYMDRYQAKIVSLDPPPDIYLPAMIICPNCQTWAYEKFSILVKGGKK
jgi:hypothetical protein